MTCRSGCPTQEHSSYAECLKDMRIAIPAGDSAPVSLPARR